MRGKHGNRGNAIPASILVKINEHVNSFPKHTSHYSSTPVKYLDAQLNVTKMYELFINKYPDLREVVRMSFT